MTSTTEQLSVNGKPTATNLADLYELAPLDWEDVCEGLAAHLGGQPARIFWLSTGDANGRPHMTAVAAHWVDGRYYFCGGPRSRKIRNIERDPRCALGVAIDGYDVALEGQAERVTDEGQLVRLAEVFAEGKGAATVAEGGFTHPVCAPSAGPPPWHVYRFTPDDVYAVMTGEPGGATHWTF
jgi:hypothetical protein